MRLTVATEMAKAALFEHCAISSSMAMIFLTRATVFVSVCSAGEEWMTYVEEQRSR